MDEYTNSINTSPTTFGGMFAKSAPWNTVHKEDMTSMTVPSTFNIYH
jgi:hypothetical protein